MSLLTTQPQTLMAAHVHYVGESVRYAMTPPRGPGGSMGARAALRKFVRGSRGARSQP